MESKLAPICLFTYNRLEETQKTITALQNDFLASKSKLIIFSDGPKDCKTKIQVDLVRKYLNTITGFKSIKIVESSKNKGLGDSIIDGVTEVLGKYARVIVLEDDLRCTPNFLSYMNETLDYYENDSRIISVCGYGLKIKKPKDYHADVYLYGRSSSWGWATWQDRWIKIDWEVKDWKVFKDDAKAIKAFNYNGSDMFKMLKSVTEGEANSWAIRFSYAQFVQNKYSIMPFYSKIENCGFGKQATNTKFNYSRFEIELDTTWNTEFSLSKDILVNHAIEKECYKYHSLPIRIYSRIRYKLGI